MVVLYVVNSDLSSIVILTDKFFPDSDSIPDIFVSEDDSVDECHDGGSICDKFHSFVLLLYLQINSFLILTLSLIFSLARMIALMSAMMVV